MLKRIFRKKKKPAGPTLISNLYNTSYGKNVLISYIVYPFKSTNGFWHQNYFTSHLIAEVFSEQGYNVDVADFHSKTETIDYGKYDVVFGFGHIYERSFYHEGRKKTKRILFVTGAHEEFQNIMSLRCVEDFYQISEKWIPSESKVLADRYYYSSYNSDIAIILAESHIYNDFRSRFKHLLFSLNNNIIGAFKDFEEKTIQNRSRNFLFLSGAFQLAKGLHIFLELVKRRKDLNFYLILPNLEVALEEYYRDVLYDNPNLVFYKAIRMDSAEMREAIEKCSYVLSPSYVDGLPGGTIEPMSAGLIPIVSKYCGFAAKDFIFEMEELTTECLEQNIEKVLALTDEEYLAHSSGVKNYTLANFNIASVKESFKNLIATNLK